MCSSSFGFKHSTTCPLSRQVQERKEWLFLDLFLDMPEIREKARRCTFFPLTFSDVGLLGTSD
jgi:hypothetical protein